MTRVVRWGLGALAISCGLVMAVSASAQKANYKDSLVVEVSVIYGRPIRIKACSQTVVLNPFQPRNDTTVHCVLVPVSDSAMRRRELSVRETAVLRELVAAADLWDAPGVGRDEREMDGLLVTVALIQQDGSAVAVVVSGNPAFLEPGPRRDLIEELARIRNEQVARLVGLNR